MYLIRVENNSKQNHPIMSNRVYNEDKYRKLDSLENLPEGTRGLTVRFQMTLFIHDLADNMLYSVLNSDKAINFYFSDLLIKDDIDALGDEFYGRDLIGALKHNMKLEEHFPLIKAICTKTHEINTHVTHQNWSRASFETYDMTLTLANFFTINSDLESSFNINKDDLLGCTLEKRGDVESLINDLDHFYNNCIHNEDYEDISTIRAMTLSISKRMMSWYRKTLG